MPTECERDVGSLQELKLDWVGDGELHHARDEFSESFMSLKGLELTGDHVC